LRALSTRKMQLIAAGPSVRRESVDIQRIRVEATVDRQALLTDAVKRGAAPAAPDREAR
jgi:hypothetical protein